MSIGDSVTAGYTDNPTWSVRFDFGYRLGLYKLMTNAGYSIQYVGNSVEPWSGEYGKPKLIGSPDLRTIDQDHHHGYAWMTAEIAQERISDWLNADNPDVILLTLGGINFQTTRDVESVQEGLSNLVQRIVIERPAVHIIVAEIPPFAMYFPYVTRYNEITRTLLVPEFASQGHRVTSVDQYSNFLQPGGSVTAIDRDLFSNGWHHPSPEGYSRMAKTWFDRIRSLYPNESVTIVGPPTMLPNGHFLVTFSGAANALYQVDRSTALEGPWENGFTMLTADAEGRFTLEDANPGIGPARFYRVAPR